MDFQKTDYNATITETEGKILSITGLPHLVVINWWVKYSLKRQKEHLVNKYNIPGFLDNLDLDKKIKTPATKQNYKQSKIKKWNFKRLIQVISVVKVILKMMTRKIIWCSNQFIGVFKKIFNSNHIQCGNLKDCLIKALNLQLHLTIVFLHCWIILTLI